MGPALRRIGLLACVTAGCGRSWADPFVREVDREPRRCEGLLWAANGDGDLVLVDVARGTSRRFGSLPVGTWALGTDEADGRLWLWEAVGENPRLFTFDPWTGEDETVSGLETEDNMDRGGFGPDGSFWAVAVPSQVVHAYDDATAEMTSMRLPDVGAGHGGDLAAVGGAIALVWWPDRIGIVSPSPDTNAPVTRETAIGLGDVQLSGIAVTDDRVWVATYDGRFFDLGPLSAIDEIEVRGAFETDLAVSDLAPVVARGSCPRP